jgi:AraC family transcriptional regulator
MPVQSTNIAINGREKLFSKNLFVSDFYEIKHWSYDLLAEQQDMNGFNDCLCLVYVKKGNFLFDLSVKKHEMHSGYILLEKPGCDYRMRPSAGAVTIFNFTDEFRQQCTTDLQLEQSYFFGNQNLLSVILQSTPATDYLHHQVLNNLNDAGKLEMDTRVIELFSEAAGIITNHSAEVDTPVASKFNRLTTVERAKEYMNTHFSNDISLQEVALNSFISPFHFSRLFKKITSFSPHQYLQQVRLKHAEMLLKNSNLPVADIAYNSGFSSTAYFATAFKQHYKANPLQYRKMNG